MQIIPAILESDLNQVVQKVRQVQLEGHFNLIQIDIIDGNLAPRLTVTPADLATVDFGALKLDFHLMTQDPLDYVWELASTQPPLPVHAVFGQVERMSDQKAFLTAVSDQKWQAGLALDLTTPPDSIDDQSWPLLDAVLLLSVPLGAQGQTFNDTVFSKITALRQLAAANNQPNLPLVIDGGIKPPLLKRLKQANISAAAIGSFLWSGAN